MSHLSLEIPLIPTLPQDDMISSSWQWLMGMPHGNIDYGDRDYKSMSDEFLAKSINQSVRILNHEDTEGLMFGIQYVNKEENDRRWTTEVISQRSSKNFTVSIKVTCDSGDAAIHLPTPKKPYLIKMIMNNNWAGYDGDIKISDQYRVLDRENPEFVEPLLYGDFKNTLPIVYVSMKQNRRFPINPSYLARHLGGLAHVFIEPDLDFSRQVSRITGSENPFNGAVGLYWPDGIRRKLYLSEEFENRNSETVHAIYRSIITALSNRRISPESTWQSLIEKVSKKKINNLIEQKSTEINEYIAYVEEEMNAKEQKMRQAEEEIQRLREEIISIKKISSVKGKNTLNFGEEPDYFIAEKKNHVVAFLKEHVDKKPENWRSRHIIQSIINENQGNGEINKDNLISIIKDALRDYRSMTPKARSLLTEAGFSIADGGKHYKIKWNNDERYVFSLSKTASDGRSGKNLTSDICKVLFG